MPNWCYNVVELTHEDPAMIARARTAFRDGRFLDEFIPVPRDLVETTSGFLGDGEKQAELEQRSAANRGKYGYANWYDFCTNEWGTKWDVGGHDCDEGSADDTHLSLSFDSAWSPPIEAYRKMVAEHGFNIVAYYYEPGMAFCGQYFSEYDSDDYYDVSDMSADEIEATIPEELDGMFGISSDRRDWEESEIDSNEDAESK